MDYEVLHHLPTRAAILRCLAASLHAADCSAVPLPAAVSRPCWLSSGETRRRDARACHQRWLQAMHHTVRRLLVESPEPLHQWACLKANEQMRRLLP